MKKKVRKLQDARGTIRVKARGLTFRLLLARVYRSRGSVGKHEKQDVTQRCRKETVV